MKQYWDNWSEEEREVFMDFVADVVAEANKKQQKEKGRVKKEMVAAIQLFVTKLSEELNVKDHKYDAGLISYFESIAAENNKGRK